VETLPKRPSWQWYFLPGGIFVLGSALFAAWFMLGLLERVTDHHKFMAPGSAQIRIDHTGQYVVWDYSNVSFQGSQYQYPPLPAGVLVEVVDPDGQQVPLRSYGSETVSGQYEGPFEGRSVFSFVAPKKGTYRVDVSGVSTPRVMGVGRGVLATVAWVFLGPVPFEFATVTLAGVTALVVWSRRRKAVAPKPA
jgi:hypothetical protein